MTFTERFNLATGRNERWGVPDKEEYFRRNASNYFTRAELKECGYSIGGERRREMTLNELISELQGEQGRHGEKEVGYEVNKDSVDILIGEDPDTGSSITIPEPSW